MANQKPKLPEVPQTTETEPEQPQQPEQQATMGGDGALDRKPFTEGAEVEEQSQFGRAPLGQPRNLDADFYVAKYPDKKLMWVNDIGGDVQRWIDVGAEPVAVENRSGRTFEGITDVTDSKWVRAIGGDDGTGNSFWVYLLMVDPQIYYDVQERPEEERRKAVHDSMYRGRDQSDTKSGLQSYAPNLPTGDVGMNVAHETEQ